MGGSPRSRSQRFEEVRVDVAGSPRHDGIDEVRTYVAKLTDEHVDHLTIRHLLSRGEQVAAEGATPSSRFSHVIMYAGHGKTAKVAEIVSYIASVSG